MTYQCRLCLKKYSNQSNLNQHTRNKHNQVIIASEKSNLRCLEDGCNNAFVSQRQFRNHLTEEHGIQFEEIVFTVSTMSEFEEWKRKMEKETISFYRIHDKSTNCYSYDCNRSGTKGNKRSNVDLYKRQEKSQRSCKMSSKCTSCIKLDFKNPAEIKVHWVKTHYGHDPELQHIRLPNQDRLLIASKLISGIPPTRILQATTDSISSHPKRVDLLTRQDVRNIKMGFKIEGDSGKRHTNDAISVDLWVEEQKQNGGDENPILFYKTQGIEEDGFSTNDFCLVFMNGVQKDIYKKFGSNIIAIDGTHGLNGYDFELITLMVIDEFNQGFPVAFMFTNRKDTNVYCFFFKMIKINAGLLQAKTFMSDLEGAFYSAWISVMGPTKYSLFCSWHVDRAWQTNLSKIADQSKRNEVYKHLKVLQQQTEEITFRQSLETFIKNLMEDNTTIPFGKYFDTYYSKNYLKWAYCFRTECGINTNMHLESMHKVIKYFYLEKKVVRRLDRGLHAVMQYLKDRTLSRYIDLTKGKTTKIKRLNFLRHNDALSKPYNLIERDGEYHITTEALKSYDIKKVMGTKCCENVCTTCEICRHMYTCTCPDFLRNNSICKHIHYVVMHTSKFAPSTSSSLFNNDGLNTLAQQLDLCQKSAVEQKYKRSENAKQEALAALLAVNFEEYDDDVLKEMDSCLGKFVNLTRMKKNSTSTAFTQPRNDESVNKLKINPQKRFTSTKKKRKSTTNVCGNPKIREAEDIKNILTGGSSLFISSDKSIDHNYV